MEFEITSDGELTKYNGPGGDVVIPEGVRFIAREGVFDPGVKITSLRIPRGLIGHRCNADDELAFVYHQYSFGSHVLISCKDDYLSNARASKNVYFYPLCLDLPHLERYDVDAYSEVYSSPCGILVLNCISCVIDVPKCSSVPVSLACAFKEYDQRARKNTSHEFNRYKGLAVKFDIDADELIIHDDYFDIFNTAGENLFIFYAPRAKRLVAKREPHVWTDKINAILIAPNLDVHALHSVDVRRLAFGYCYDSKVYSEEKVAFCVETLESLEKECYTYARHEELSPVLDYYKNSWVNKVIHHNDINTQAKASRYLIDTILFGSVADVQQALKVDFSFIGLKEPGNEISTDGGEVILALACRYGGYEKLKCLLSSDKFINPVNGKAKSVLSSFMEHNMLLSLDGSFIRDFSRYCSLAFTSHKDVCMLSPISSDERFKCLNLLLHSVSMQPSYKQSMYFMLQMSGEVAVDELISENVDLAQFVLSLKSQEQRDAYYAAIKLALQENPKGVVTLAKLLKDNGSILTINDKYDLSSLIDRADIVQELFLVTRVDGAVLHRFIIDVAKANKIETLLAVLRSRTNLTKPMINKFIELCEEAQNRKCVAAILDFQAANKSKGKKTKDKAKSKLKP